MTAMTTLAERGLRLQAVVDVARLPEWAMGPLREAGIDPGGYQRLVMLAQGGPTLWAAIQDEGLTSESRFDEYSRRLVGHYIDELGGPRHVVVYPGEVVLPLGRLAELVGWGRASPLGLTINDRYGLWMAHRIAFLVDHPLDLHVGASEHPCDSCAATPCVGACPVGAVSVDDGFDVDVCARFRLAPYSPCADRCLARLACPIGTEHIYGDDQMRYHYAAGLASIREWYES